MRHNKKLSKKEKINIWLELCEFSFKLMKNSLSNYELNKRLKRMREEHIKRDHKILVSLSKLSK